MNIGDLGQDLEHCLKLRKQLREFRGVWAGVRRPCLGEVGQRIPALGATAQSTDEYGLWSHMWAQVAAPHSLPARA